MKKGIIKISTAIMIGAITLTTNVGLGSKIGSFKKRYIFIYPLFLVFFHFVFLCSTYLKIFKKNVKWKDRDISLK